MIYALSDLTIIKKPQRSGTEGDGDYGERWPFNNILEMYVIKKIDS